MFGEGKSGAYVFQVDSNCHHRGQAILKLDTVKHWDEQERYHHDGLNETSKDRQLEPFREDADDHYLTTNHGVRVNRTDDSKACERGPTLMEDFHLREMTHFDHERVPERVVTCPRLGRTRLLPDLRAAHRPHEGRPRDDGVGAGVTRHPQT